jgi:hypothetical protein
MALNEHEKALNLLEILHKNSDDPIIKSQYEMIKQTVAQKKPQA